MKLNKIMFEDATEKSPKITFYAKSHSSWLSRLLALVDRLFQFHDNLFINS